MSVIELETPRDLDETVQAPAVNRMAIAVLALAGMVIAAYMLMYKLGIIESVACGTGSCEAVQASPWSIFLGFPVPLIGLVGYGLILVCALAGVQPRFADDRRVGIVLLALTAVAFVFSVYLSAMEAFFIRAWCRWCIGSAVVATLLFLCAIPEIPRLRRTARG